MIDTLVNVGWTAEGDLFRVATPDAPLPEELELLSRPDYFNRVVRRKRCPCCDGNAVSLLVNWLYAELRILLLDSPVIYCLKMRRLLLLRADEEALRQRLLQLSTAELSPPVLRRAGVGQRISQGLVGDAVERALNVGGPREAKFSPDANALLAERPTESCGDSLPSALAFHSSALPEHITLKLEPTTRCNFECGFCYGRHIEQGSLSMEDFRRILDRFPALASVELTGEGEPLVNRHIYEMVRICSRRGIWTHLTTNGSLLNQKNCELLLDAGLSSLAVSIESLDAGQFARLRPRGKLAMVIEGIHTLNLARKKSGKRLKLSLWVTLLRETLPELDNIESFAREAEIDVVEYQTLNSLKAYTRFYDDSLLKNLLGVAEMEEIIRAPATSPAMRSALGPLAESYRGRRCDVFMNTAMVYWQGNVTPCCLLKTPHFPYLGDLTAESLEEVWGRADFRLFRFALQHGVVLKSCEGCAYLGSS